MNNKNSELTTLAADVEKAVFAAMTSYSLPTGDYPIDEIFSLRLALRDGVSEFDPENLSDVMAVVEGTTVNTTMSIFKAGSLIVDVHSRIEKGNDKKCKVGGVDYEYSMFLRAAAGTINLTDYMKTTGASLDKLKFRVVAHVSMWNPNAIIQAPKCKLGCYTGFEVYRKVYKSTDWKSEESVNKYFAAKEVLYASALKDYVVEGNDISPEYIDAVSVIRIVDGKDTIPKGKNDSKK